MKTKVLKAKHNTPKIPLTPTVVGFMAVDHWHLNQIWCGALITLGAIVWIVAISQFFTSDPREPMWQSETGPQPAFNKKDAIKEYE